MDKIEVGQMVAETKKKEMSPGQIYQKNIETMPARQMSGHLRRKARNTSSMIDDTYAIVLATIFDNTLHAGAGGKMESYLR